MMDDLELRLLNPNWQLIFSLNRGQKLLKGRRNNIYKAIIGECKSVKNENGVYAWGISFDKIYYIGSYSNYTRDDMETNLQARIHNYLQNHKTKTNKRIFDLINNRLEFENISLFSFSFSELEFCSQNISFSRFSSLSYLTRMVEYLLIAHYKSHNLCEWNIK